MTWGRLISDRQWLKTSVISILAAFLLLLAGCGLSGVQTEEQGKASVSVERPTAEGVVIGVEHAATNTISWRRRTKGPRL